MKSSWSAVVQWHSKQVPLRELKKDLEERDA